MLTNQPDIILKGCRERDPQCQEQLYKHCYPDIIKVCYRYADGVNIQQLGWINCDRFNNDARPRTELIVDLGDNPDNYNTLLVFDNFDSIMPPSTRQGNTIHFLNLPEGEPARIISVGIRNDKPVTAMRKLIISKTSVSDLDFDEISASTFRKKLGQ